jgi:hypothetical protein
MIPIMINRLRSAPVDGWFLWVACLLVVGAAAVPVVAPGRGTNRIAGVAFPLAIGAVVLAVNALTRGRSPWLSALLYTIASGAILYGLILALSVPLRLAVEGVCQPAPAPCQLGFDRPITSAESFGVTALCVLGALSLLFTFIAAEIEYIHRPKLQSSGGVGLPPTQEGRPPSTGS